MHQGFSNGPFSPDDLLSISLSRMIEKDIVTTSSFRLAYSLWRLTFRPLRVTYLYTFIFIIIGSLSELLFAATFGFALLFVLQKSIETSPLSHLAFAQSISTNISHQGGLVILLAGLLLSAAFILLKLISLKCINNCSAEIGSYIGSLMYKAIIGTEFETVCSLDHSSVTNRLSIQTNQVVNGVIKPLINSCFGLFTAVFLIVPVVFVQPQLVLILVLLLVSAYQLLGKLIKLRLTMNSLSILNLQGQLLKIIRNTMSDFRAICLTGLGADYYKLFKSVNRSLRYRQAETDFISAWPKILIDSCSLLGFMILAAYLKTNSGNFYPSPSFLVFVVIIYQRIMPILQQIMASSSLIRSNSASIVDIVATLEQSNSPLNNFDIRINHTPFRPHTSPVVVQELASIEIKDLAFCYSNSTKSQIIYPDFVFSAGKFYTICGVSGSGKTTLIDLMCGLLTPSSGLVKYNLMNGSACVADSSIMQTLATKGITSSYCSQRPFIVSGTILDNLILGNEQPDSEWLSHVINASCLSALIANKPLGIKSQVGDGGSLISGGQQQRLAIARALLCKPSLLFLDESTSGLDKHAEACIFSNIRILLPRLIIISISHSEQVSQLSDCVLSL